MDTLQASAHLRRLRDLDMLQMKGAGNRTYYVPGRRMVAYPQQADANTHQLPATDPHQVDANTHQLPAADPHQADANTHQLAPRPQLEANAKTGRGAAKLPAALTLRVDALGEKPRREVLRTLIVEICRLRPYSARELARLLKRRDTKWLARDHLTPMIEDGQLVYTNPAVPNHPEQKYTTPALRDPSG